MKKKMKEKSLIFWWTTKTRSNPFNPSIPNWKPKIDELKNLFIFIFKYIGNNEEIEPKDEIDFLPE